MADKQTEESAQSELAQDEVFRLLERAASKDHPNPERLGCPSQDVLLSFARDVRSFQMDDPIFEHLASCSPCFRFVREARGQTA